MESGEPVLDLPSTRQARAVGFLKEAVQRSPHFLGALLLGSLAAGAGDALSDVDTIVIAPDDGFAQAWAARAELQDERVLCAWDQRSPQVPEAAAHKWITHDIVLVESLICSPSSGVRLAPPHVVLAGPPDLPRLLPARAVIDCGEMAATGNAVEDAYDALKAAVRAARRAP
jgi:hypothetical protein